VNSFIRYQSSYIKAITSNTSQQLMYDEFTKCVQAYPFYPERNRCYNLNNPNFVSQKEIEQWEKELSDLVEKGLSVDTVLIKWLGPHAKNITYSVAPVGTTQYCVVTQDDRPDPVFVFTIKHTLYLLGPGWSTIIFHSVENKQFLINELDIRPGGLGENIELFEVTNIRNAHSSLPLSSEYWSKIPCENVIVIQQDVIMRKSIHLESTISDSNGLFELMEESDYLGGPWREETPLFIGNGGCSYRRRSTMIRTITKTDRIECTLSKCTIEDEYDSIVITDLNRFWEFNEDWVLEKLFKARYRANPDRFWRMANQTPLKMAKFAASDVQSVNYDDPYFTHKLWAHPKPAINIKMFAPIKQYYIKPQTFVHK